MPRFFLRVFVVVIVGEGTVDCHGEGALGNGRLSSVIVTVGCGGLSKDVTALCSIYVVGCGYVYIFVYIYNIIYVFFVLIMYVFIFINTYIYTLQLYDTYTC